MLVCVWQPINHYKGQRRLRGHNFTIYQQLLYTVLWNSFYVNYVKRKLNGVCFIVYKCLCVWVIGFREAKARNTCFDTMEEFHRLALISFFYRLYWNKLSARMHTHKNETCYNLFLIASFLNNMKSNHIVQIRKLPFITHWSLRNCKQLRPVPSLYLSFSARWYMLTSLRCTSWLLCSDFMRFFFLRA